MLVLSCPLWRLALSEVFTPELTAREDLQMLICRYLSGIGNAAPPVDALVSFYLDARQLMQDSLQVSGSAV